MIFERNPILRLDDDSGGEWTIECGPTLTLGTERWALRVTKGKLSRRSVFRENWPDVFLILRGRRWPWHD